MKNEKLKIRLSDNLQKLPPYLFAEIDKAKRQARAQGRDLIDLGIGDPDQPTPKHIIQKLYEAALDPANHRYALDQGMPALRAAIRKWYINRFKVELSQDKEILPLIGSKEGIAHIPLAFLNKGDYALVPEPCYPPYKGGTILAGGVPYILPLKEENNFLPDLSRIPKSVLKKAKLLFLNYPNNPTSATAEAGFYENVIKFALKYNIIVLHDAAYSEINFGAYRPISFLEVKGAKEVGIEFHSLSKTYNMTGWRIGWACGNEKVVAALAKVKSNIDSGIFSAIQLAGVSALSGPVEYVDTMCKLYQRRRDLLVDGLNQLGWQVNKPKATFYVWSGLPKKYKSSIKFSQMLLEKADIVLTPGCGFGKSGEGYVRMALTASEDRIQEALGRLRRIL